MKLSDINTCLNPNAICEDELMVRIAKIVEVCERSKNAMVGIYLMDKALFLYCNPRCISIFSDDFYKLWDDGWGYWFSKIDLDEVGCVKELITSYLITPKPQSPLVLKYHIASLEGKQICVKHEIHLYDIIHRKIAVNYVFDVSVKEEIENFFHASYNLNNPSISNKNNLQISGREQEVLEHIANGFSSKEIADKLFISNHTVVSHRKNLIEKFKVKNTAHLIKKAAAFI
ncbi:response regulator transcription factor [Arenibacter lacus]|uniref:response regulator transcription factor n=1 Tax=Arenibacter lacus TaxID=2608629 RepID=UPI001CC3FDCE|nr:helix-turn-helix transcriptional regulator [Arenibacter lacus]